MNENELCESLNKCFCPDLLPLSPVVHIEWKHPSGPSHLCKHFPTLHQDKPPPSPLGWFHHLPGELKLPSTHQALQSNVNEANQNSTAISNFFSHILRKRWITIAFYSYCAVVAGTIASVNKCALSQVGFTGTTTAHEVFYKAWAGTRTKAAIIKNGCPCMEDAMNLYT